MPVEIPQFVRSGIDAAHRNLVHPYLTHGEAKKDREISHERALRLMEAAQNNSIAFRLMESIFRYDDPILRTSFAGIEAPNPLGVAAGFDKNFKIYRLLGEAQGFGSVTGGSATWVDYKGNDRPRIFDLPRSHGLINRMGFPGDGSKAIKERLQKDARDRGFVLVISFAASKPSFERGTQVNDYRLVAQDLVDFGDVVEMNVSSPNTPGVRGLSEPDEYKDLSQAVVPVYVARNKPWRPKFASDLGIEKLQRNAEITIDQGGSGFTITNTSVDKEIRESLDKFDIHRDQIGGISGPPITQKALEMSHQLYDYIGEELPIHRAGGIGNVRDVWDALTYGGATTVEALTTYVRVETSTPNFAYYILRDLAKAMRATGMTGMKDFKDLRGKRVPFPKV